MATNSFKFWDAFWDAMQDMSMEERGEFMTAICRFVFDGEESEIDDRVVLVSYKMVRMQLLESKEIAASARENGRRGGRPKKPTPKPPSKPVSKARREEAKRSEASQQGVGDSACGSTPPPHEVDLSGLTPDPDFDGGRSDE